ncbi:MAG: DUF5926 family protein [Candidatus Nanopelagicales bacterium]
MTEEIPVVGLREPCPCGSGKRYKACHGKARNRESVAHVVRPFEGLASECDWVAFREIVPAATAPLTLKDDADRRVVLTTVLPLAWPALVRDNGDIYLALQVTTGSGDPSRDAADALLRALESAPGAPVPPVGLPGPGPRLQDLIADVPLDVTIHEDFDYWMADETSVDAPGVRDSLDRANSKVMPTVRLTSVDAAYWVQMGDKVFLRWVMPHAEETLLNALARLHAAGDSGLAGVPSRFVGSFRADGLLVPVWELTEGTPSADVEAAAADFGTRLAAALAVDEPLTSDERRARAGLQNRQITLR